MRKVLEVRLSRGVEGHVKKQRKAATSPNGTSGATWVVRSSSSPSVKAGTRVPAGGSPTRLRQVGVAKRGTSGSAPRRRQVQRQRELERELERARGATLGAAPLNHDDAVVQKGGRASYESIVNPPEWNQGESAAAAVEGAARIARRRRTRRGN